VRHRGWGMGMAALVSACGASPDGPAGDGEPLSCEEFRLAYEVAAVEARRCNPDEPDPCGGRALESLETQCVFAVSPGSAERLHGYVDQFREMGCALGEPAPCPQRELFRCEPEPNGFVCVSAEP
jgi:hypothetical protein